MMNLNLSVMMDDEVASKKKKTVRLVDSTGIDLDSYIANYSGHGTVDRLVYIATRCVPLQVEAYTAALNELKTTLNVQRYLQVHTKLNDLLALHGKPAVSVDTLWVDATQKQARAKTDKLEAELKNYKTNAIKESIRMGYKDLGDHYYDCGDLPKAMKYYSQMRDYCTTSKHMLDMCLNVIKASLELGNFPHVQSYVLKAEATPDLAENAVAKGKLKCSMGLTKLDNAEYKRAARFFLDTSFELGNNFNDIISPNDIAIYGGLTALATFDRQELKSKVFDNSDFKQFLELKPHIRELLESFYNSKYVQCLELFDRMKNDLLLDVFFSNHVEVIYDLIRKKALVQYFSPFLSVDLNRMAKAFNTTVALLEPELAGLIMEGQIAARIDSLNKVMKVKETDQRCDTFRKAISVGDSYRSQSRALVLRMTLMKADMIVTDGSRDDSRRGKAYYGAMPGTFSP